MTVFVRGFEAAAFGTNCWVVAPAEGEQCIVIDPGIGVEDQPADALGQGSVGRTVLPGGSWEQMQDSLARVVLPRADDTVVHCGHGPSTTIGRERGTNPFLQDLPVAPPSRGL